jgi:hypothetical protein
MRVTIEQGEVRDRMGKVAGSSGIRTPLVSASSFHPMSAEDTLLLKIRLNWHLDAQHVMLQLTHSSFHAAPME